MTDDVEVQLSQPEDPELKWNLSKLNMRAITVVINATDSIQQSKVLKSQLLCAVSDLTD